LEYNIYGWLNMPNIMTHYKFCADRVKDDLKEIAILGSQGPDPFFFYMGSLKKNIKKHSKLASSMHRMDPYIMYEYFIDYALKKKGKEKDILFSFIKGAMYHYCVDRNCHPYIFYVSGFKTEENKKKIKFGVSHSALETYIDVLLIEKYNIKTNTREAIEAPIEQIRLVSVMIYSFVKDVMNCDFITPSSYYDAVVGMRRAQWVLSSKYGIKKAIFRTLFRRTSLNTMCMPRKVKNNDKLDCLNERKSIWREPDTGKERNESFLELLDMSSRDGDIVDDILDNAIKNKEYKDELIKFTKKINHHGIHIDDTKKYYSLIWNRLKK